MKIRNILVILFTIISCLFITGCKKDECKHTFTDATCTKKSYCTKCNIEVGEPLDHKLVDATCTKKSYCIECNEEFGELANHKLIDATIEHPAYCEVCNEEFGDKLEVIRIEYKTIINRTYLTEEECNNLKSYLTVYGIVEDGRRFELSEDDINIKYLDKDNEIVIKYQDFEIVTFMKKLGYFENVGLDLNDLEFNKMSILTDGYYLEISIDALNNYAKEKGYDNYRDYILGEGFKAPGISREYMGPIIESEYAPVEYYVKDGYCMRFYQYRFSVKEPSPDTVFAYKIFITKLPDNFEKLELNKEIVPNLDLLCSYVSSKDNYKLTNDSETLLNIEGNCETISYNYILESITDSLVEHFNELCQSFNTTFRLNNVDYYHYSLNEEYDIVLEVNHRTNEYCDISISIITK